MAVNGKYYYGGNGHHPLLGRRWVKGDLLPDEVGQLRQLRSLESAGVVVFIPEAPAAKDQRHTPARSVRGAQEAAAAAAPPSAAAAPVKKAAAKKTAAKKPAEPLEDATSALAAASAGE